MSEKDKANLLAILDSAKKILGYTKEVPNADAFFENDMIFDATLMNFVIIGETVVKISNSLKENNSHVPWARIKGFRNIIAHNYFGVDAEEVWQIIKNNIPVLISDISDILDTE